MVFLRFYGNILHLPCGELHWFSGSGRLGLYICSSSDGILREVGFESLWRSALVGRFQQHCRSLLLEVGELRFIVRSHEARTSSLLLTARCVVATALPEPLLVVDDRTLLVLVDIGDELHLVHKPRSRNLLCGRLLFAIEVHENNPIRLASVAVRALDHVDLGDAIRAKEFAKSLSHLSFSHVLDGARNADGKRVGCHDRWCMDCLCMQK